MTENRLIWVALIISIATFQFWMYLPENSFYIGSSIYITILATIIYMQNKELFISFFLLCIAVNNLIDEMFFDPKLNGANEIIAAILIPILYYARKNYKHRNLRFFNENYISRIFSSRGKNSNRNEKK